MKKELLDLKINIDKTPELQLRFIKTRDYVYVECQKCGIESRKQVNNLLRYIRAGKQILCRSCGGKAGRQ